MSVSKMSKELFPENNILEENGWTVEVVCEGVFTQNFFGVAKEGDPKGFVTFSNNEEGIDVFIGKEDDTCPYCGIEGYKIPVNLSKPQSIAKKNKSGDKK